VGFNLDTTVDCMDFGVLTLGPGQEGTWWFSWAFDSTHWARMSALPESPHSRLDVVAEWSTLAVVNPPRSPNAPEPWPDPFRLYVRWRNPGPETISFRPTVLVAPRRS
jgi:hypothetical protein